MKRILSFLHWAPLLVIINHTHAATDPNETAWFNYFGDHPLKGTSLELHLDTQLRRDQLGAKPMQILVQPGLNYSVNKNWKLGMGYGYMRTYRYGEFPVPTEIPEHRVWEQISRPTIIAGLTLTHRLRLEQRHIGQPVPGPAGQAAIGSFRYENRIRYRLATKFPILKSYSDRYYMVLFNEVFLNLGRQVAKNHFDQNRAYIGFGRRLGKHAVLEMGFMEQTVQHRDGVVWEHNHTLMISFLSNLPF